MWKPPKDGSTPDGWEQTDTTRDMMGTVRRYWWTPFAVAAVATFVVGAARTSGDDDVRPAIRDEVRALDGDCAGLQAAFDRTDVADELSYIDDAMRSAGCYD